MKINAKILKFFQEKGISKKEIADSYGGTSQNIWNILNKESGKVPLDFLIWLAENHPELNINVLLQPDTDASLVSEPYSVYEKKPATKEEILAEISKVLDKYL
ncbi:hypothetical protein [Chryseobacterium sp. MP_3.2]|uniref:hypothetical protein n=1 Tax=Chryseobacterium sp. MP_3.2 TaxID=3071712 RepID=UPI002DFE1CE9|nr:transcriptional regulator with XRE-family HTH domain [Chryseobacterium sp. MP_3.2]